MRQCVLKCPNIRYGRLHNDPACRLRPTGPTGNLRDQLKQTLLRAKVTRQPGRIGIQHPTSDTPGKSRPFAIICVPTAMSMRRD